MRSFNAHTSQITSLVFSPNGTNLLSAGQDNKLIVWDMVSYQKQAQIDYDEEIESMSYFKVKNQNYVAIAGKQLLCIVGLLTEHTKPRVPLAR